MADRPPINATPNPVPPASPAAAPEPARAAPIAVVWCRQVDNEAESPGYTSLPAEFPGQRETLDVVRIVGNLTVNVSDTQDYWSPGPPAPLSYYPNLFLYPAFGGRYTCVGRMFLSTEDRPRLGMKTVVLDTGRLLEGGAFGPLVADWYTAMAGGETARGPPTARPAPDAALYGILGEAFLFHRGATEPVVAVADSEVYDDAMAVVLELVRRLPASLTSIGAVLAFPYFLPQPKTNLFEFTETLPLALALMRVPKGEATGERHKKRLQSWASASVALRDLTDGLPAATRGGRGSDGGPQVLRYVREADEERLAPVVRRVDLVEIPKVRALIADPERQSGRERRREMWRIGTAMESAALLLRKPRGRHHTVSPETARRAQEYVRARLPEAERSLPTSSPAVSPSPPSASPAAPSATRPEPAPRDGRPAVPAWLAAVGSTTAPAPGPAGPEEVPVPIDRDPSLRTAGATAVPTGPGADSAPARTAQGLDRAALMAEIESVIARGVEQRLADIRSASQTLETDIAGRIETVAEAKVEGLRASMDARMAQEFQELQRRTDTRLGEELPHRTQEHATRAREELAEHLERRLTESEAGHERAVSDLARTFEYRLVEVENRETQRVTALLASTENRLREALAHSLGGAIDRRLGEALHERLAETGADGQPGAFWSRVRELSADQARTAADAERVALLAAVEAEVGRASAGAETRVRDAVRDEAAGWVREHAQNLRGEVEALGQRVEESQRRHGEELVRASAHRLAESEARQAQVRRDENAQLEERLRKALGLTIASELDRRVRAQVETHLAESRERFEEAQRTAAETLAERLRGESGRVAEEAREAAVREAELAAKSLGERVDRHLQDSLTREMAARAELRAGFEEALQRSQAEAEERAGAGARELETRLRAVVDERTRETRERVEALPQEVERRFVRPLENRLQQEEARLERAVESRLAEMRDVETQSVADLQVRLEAYADQKLREAQERDRATYVELLARMRRELDQGLARAADPSRVEGVAQRVEAVQRDVASHEQEISGLEDAIRGELEELDRRLVVLSERLVPVVRKTWLRIADLEKGPSPTEALSELEARSTRMRQEFAQEIHRLESELQEQNREMRERMETTIANQGKVWLAVIRQLSQLTEERRSLAERHAGRRGHSSSPGAPAPGSPTPPAPGASGRSRDAALDLDETDESLAELPALVRGRGGISANGDFAPPEGLEEYDSTGFVPPSGLSDGDSDAERQAARRRRQRLQARPPMRIEPE